MARLPKPSALKLIEGNKGKRALNKQEPDPEYLSDLTAPAWLSPAAVTVWDEVAPHLRTARLLTKIDADALAMGCNAIAQYRMASKECEEGMVLAGENGKYTSPWMIIQSMSFKQAMTIFQQFGMSPAARTRIAVNPQGDLFGSDKTGGDYFS